MPNVNDYENQNDWMGACMPKMMDEGKPNDEAVAACMNMWKEKKSFGGMTMDEAVKYFLNRKGWVTINGAHVLIGEEDSGSGSSSSSSSGGRGWASPLEEFRFVNRRLAAGNLKPGEQRMLERRAERLAREHYGVPVDGKSVIKGMMSEMDCIAACQDCIKACMDCLSMMEKCPNQDATHQACKQDCRECIGACQMCISDLQGNASMADCMQTCQKCAEMCMTCVETAEKVAASCDNCKDMCQMCSETCGVCSEKCQMQSGAMEMKNVKVGARNNHLDQQRIQDIHDMSVMNGAQCSMEDKSIYFGAEVKALGNGKVGGYLVRFSDDNSPDLTGDYFDAKTNVEFPDSLPVLYQHGFDPHFGKRVIGNSAPKKDEVGIWLEAQLNLRDEYEKAVYALAEKGKLGWSSGALSHLVEREPVGKAMHITSWFIGEASLTPTPAEPRNAVVSMKSLVITSEAAATDKEDKQIAAQTAKENLDMEANEIKALFDEQKEAIKSLVATEAETAAQKAVEKVLDGLPEVKARMNGNIQVTHDEADTPFKSVGENIAAAYKYAKTGMIHPRIRGLQAMEVKAALGSNEAIPSQGEFLLEPTITSELLKPVHESGVFSQNARKLPVNPNSNSGWIPGVDETSRAAGSRWGGVRGYHSAEAATMTASQPKFRKINWELHKAYVLQYATDELLNDAAMLTAIINQSSAEELNFMVNDDLLNGVGGDRPQGVLNSGALISVSRAATSAIGHADILAMWQRMLPRNRANAVWYINSEAEPQLDALTFTSGTTGILSPYVRYDNTGVMNIKGRPVVVTEFNAALGTAGDILLADMSEYLMWEKNAVEAASSIHVQFLTDQTAFRFVYRYDGQTALASAITPYKGTNTQSPFVCLLATT